uniref:Guanine nucleotide-binding protein subunit gamma n=1 Tax=Oryctolagus cuniculus TaxID=9986 RepID=A0A5F9DD56_RABIT
MSRCCFWWWLLVTGPAPLALPSLELRKSSKQKRAARSASCSKTLISSGPGGLAVLPKLPNAPWLGQRSCRGSSMKEGMSSNSTTSISQARKAVEQLKMEACMDRVKVSQAAADLLAYCEAHVREDPLISPVPASENPFREKKFFCTIL